MKARARCELKQLGCYINPDFSVKMSDVSEHSDSEFYYIDDLSDTELLQLPTSFESEEKKSKLLTDEEVHNFIRNQQQASTVKKTMYDMNVFQKFLDECGEKRRITEIAPAELDSLLCNFYITAKKKDNTAYEPDTMSSFSRSIQRYLEDNKAKFNILKDEEFKVSREVLKSKRRELKKQGKGNKPNATVALTNEDIERIFDENQFGTHDPDVLSRTMWFLLTLHFGHRARHEARQMKFGDIVLRKDGVSGEEYLEWSTEKESKTRHGEENEHQRSFRPKAYETGDKKCPVSCFKEFVNRRPTAAKSPESPFFLAVRHRRKPEDQIWFLNSPMGKNKIGKFLSNATKDLPLSRSGKYSNHSVRKTCIKTLLDSGVSHNSVAQLSGHKSLKSLDSYAVASHQQQRQMSKILSGKENSEPKPNPNQSSGRTVQDFNQTPGIFSGANIGVINIQNFVLSEASGSKQSSHISLPNKRRCHVIESSDEED